MENFTPYRLTKKEEIKRFILAGKAQFTVVNIKTENRATYKVSQYIKEDGSKTPYFVSFLNGSDNDNSYKYLGCIFENGGFKITKKSPSTDSMSYIIFNWIYNTLFNKNTDLPEEVHFYHVGKCCRCGRTLTTPESIRSGIGPICSNL